MAASTHFVYGDLKPIKFYLNLRNVGYSWLYRVVIEGYWVMGFQIKNSRYAFLVSVSAGALLLSGCFPEDEVAVSNNNRAQKQAMIANYTQSFQQYSAKSLNHTLNSAAWADQTLAQGLLSDPNLDMGKSEGYIQSAYCNIGAEPYHLTWFESAGSDGNIVFKGLGQGLSGQVARHVMTKFPDDHIGMMQNGQIVMKDDNNNDVMLNIASSAACSTISIPGGSVVAAIRMPEPVTIASLQNKMVTRTRACGAGSEGNIVEYVNAQYQPDGDIIVSGTSYANETAIFSAGSITWLPLSNGCVALNDIDGIDVIDSVNYTALSASDIKAAFADKLISNLNQIECKTANKKAYDDNDDANNDDNDESDNNDQKAPDEAEKLYDTCGDRDDRDINLADTSLDLESTVESEIIIESCPQINGGTSTVTVNTSDGDKYRGLPASLDSKSGTLNAGTLNGQVALNKTTRTYLLNNNGEETKTSKSYSFTGGEIACERPNTLSFSCSQIYPDAGGNVIDTTETYYTIEDIYGYYTNRETFKIDENKKAQMFNGTSATYPLPNNGPIGNEVHSRSLIIRGEGLDDGEIYTKQSLIEKGCKISGNGIFVSCGVYIRREMGSSNPNGGHTRTSPYYFKIVNENQINSNQGLTYRSTSEIKGWDDPIVLTPKSPVLRGSGWSTNSTNINCSFKKSETTDLGSCGSGYTGSKTKTTQYSFTSNNPNTPLQWTEVSSSTSDTCRRQSSSSNGGGGGDDYSYEGSNGRTHSTRQGAIDSGGTGRSSNRSADRNDNVHESQKNW